MPLLALAFLVVPLLEIYIVIQVGQVIGAWPTVGILLLDALVGAWLVRHEGLRTWRALQAALPTGRVPSRELADGALVLVGGTLLLTPGFLTDVVGYLLVLPFTRPVARRLVFSAAMRRLMPGEQGRRRRGWARRARGGAGRSSADTPTAPFPPRPAGGSARVVEGEVLRSDRP